MQRISCGALSCRFHVSMRLGVYACVLSLVNRSVRKQDISSSVHRQTRVKFLGFKVLQLVVSIAKIRYFSINSPKHVSRFGGVFTQKSQFSCTLPITTRPRTGEVVTRFGFYLPYCICPKINGLPFQTIAPCPNRKLQPRLALLYMRTKGLPTYSPNWN